MQFLYPAFLWALAALAVPVIIHLFYFRRYKRVLFSNVRFLREIKEETSARNKLRNLLILFMRCLALAFLVFAFAQPFIPVSDRKVDGIRHVSVFIDNSFSMQSFGMDLPLHDRAQQRAREIVNAYGQEDRYQILTHELSAGQQRYTGKEEALSLIEETEITAEVSPLSRVLNRQHLLAEREQVAAPVIYLISDFQKSITTIGEIDSSMNVHLVPVQSVREENAAIDTVWLDTPVQILNQTSPLIVQVTNYGTTDAENVKLTMTIDGQEKPLSALNITAGATVTDTAQITVLRTGWHEVILRITDFPVQFDDTWYLTFYVQEEVRVLAVNGALPNPRLIAAFAGSTHYSLDNQPAAQLNFSEMREHDLVILNEVETVSTGMAEELYQYMSNGGRVLFFPAPGRTPESYQALLTRSGASPFAQYQEAEKSVSGINTEEFIFQDVYEQTRGNLRLPTTRGNYATSELQRSGRERILTYRDGTAFVDKYRVGNGVLLVCTAPLRDEVSDLARNAEVFIPLLYKAAILRHTKTPGAYIIGQDDLIEVDARTLDRDHVFRFRGATEFIPAMTPAGSKVLLSATGQVSQAGFYKLLAGETETGVYAFNYDRAESDLAFYTPEELTAMFGSSVSVLQASPRTSFTQLIAERDRGIQLWRWCIMLALVFLLLEILVIRVWK